MNAIRFVGLFLMCLILFSVPAMADEPAGDLEKRVKDELSTFYLAGEPTPPWMNAVDALAHADDGSASAGAYLRALLAQAAADEASGEAPWRATPFWGSSGENPARNLRESIIESLADRKSLSDAATPAIAWVLEHEEVPAFQHDAATALKATRGDMADQLIAELITPQTVNHAVLSIAIESAAERPALRAHAEAISKLAAHHHLSVRQAARRVAKVMGIDTLPRYDPAAAVRNEPVASLMKSMSAFVDLPPADAKFVRVTVTYPQPEGDPYVTSSTGWQIRRDDTWIKLFSPHGTTQRIRLTRDPDADADDMQPTISVEQIKVTDEVERVERLRAAGDESFELSEDGGLTGQFEGRGASVYEAILGLWLYESKQDQLAARIILPALDTLYADHYLAESVRQRMGRNLGRQMLVAFIGDRDYEAATRLAKRIAIDFNNTQFYEDAVLLAVELPKRAEDFKTLTLPTPDEWAKLKEKLSRGEQIDYLCVRLRLLNVYQWGQPGGISYSQTQWPTPQGLSSDAAWGGSYREDLNGALINPYTELTGKTGWGHPDGEPEPVGMRLTVDDIPRIAEHLREDWHILAVSFWRDFHPHRSLHTTREIVIGVIDGLANDDLVHVSQLTDEKTTAEEIKRIKAWAAERAGRSRSDLLLDAVERVVANGGRYFDAEGQIRILVKAEDQRVVPHLLKFLGRDDLSRFDREEVLAHMRQLNAKAALPHARKQHGKGSVGVRAVAALIELDAGDPARAVKLLDAILEEADYGNMSFGDIYTVIESLIESGRADARKVVARQFADDRLLQYSSYGGLATLVRLVAEAGEPGGLVIYRRMLDHDTNKRGNTTYGTRVSYHFAEEFLDNYGDSSPTLSRIRATTQSDTDARVDALKMWLDEKIQEVKDDSDHCLSFTGCSCTSSRPPS